MYWFQSYNLSQSNIIVFILSDISVILDQGSLDSYLDLVYEPLVHFWRSQLKYYGKGRTKDRLTTSFYYSSAGGRQNIKLRINRAIKVLFS